MINTNYQVIERLSSEVSTLHSEDCFTCFLVNQNGEYESPMSYHKGKVINDFEDDNSYLGTWNDCLENQNSHPAIGVFQNDTIYIYREAEFPGLPPVGFSGDFVHTETRSQKTDDPFISFTRFSKSGGIMTKRIFINDAWEPDKDGNSCWMSAGKAERVDCNLSELPFILSQLKPNQAISLGVNESLQGEYQILSHRDFISKGEPAGYYQRCKKQMTYPANCLCYLDVDEFGGDDADLDSLLADLIPGWQNCARFIRKSVSAGITFEGSEAFQKGGRHVYFSVLDPADLIRFKNALSVRCWLNDQGFVKVNGGGGQEIRNRIFDTATFSPERLIFEASPKLCSDRLEQVTGETVFIAGGILDTSSVFYPTEEETERYNQLVAGAKAETSDQAAEIRKEKKKTVRKTEAAKNLTDEQFETQYGNIFTERSVLPLFMNLEFDDLGTATWGEVLTDPGKYDLATLRDPLRPEKGPQKAKFFRNQDGKPCIHSFLHGGVVFFADTAELDRMKAGKLEKHLSQFGKYDLVKYHAEELADLRELCEISYTCLVKSKNNRGIKGDADSATKAIIDRRKLERKNAEKDARRKNALDTEKPKIFLNQTDNNSFVDIIRMGAAVINDVKETFYEKDGVNVFWRGQYFDQLTTDKLEYHLNLHASWYREDKDGNILCADPGNKIARLVLACDDLKLPKVKYVFNSPTIYKDGRILQKGYDEASESIVLNDADITEMSLSDAKEHLEFLFEGFPFEDNATDKVNAIGCIIAPFLSGFFHSVPIVGIEAPANRSGKTLLAQVCETAYQNKMPETDSFTGNEEELRKSITTSFQSGNVTLIFDNISFKVDSAVLAKAVTSNWRDRLLGGNSYCVSEVRPRIYLSGTNMSYSNELTHRLIRIKIDPKMPNPEERTDFKIKGGCDGMLEYCLENRDKTISAVFTFIQDWIANGKPAFSNVVKGGFDAYVAVVGGILQNAGYDGYLGNSGKINNEEKISDIQIISLMFDDFKHIDSSGKVRVEGVKAVDLYTALRENTDFSMPGKDFRGESQKFGYKMKKLVGNYFDLSKTENRDQCRVCVRLGQKNNVNAYSLDIFDIPG